MFTSTLTQKPPGTPKKKNYDFVDTIRCIAMMCIVLEHCSHFDTTVYNPKAGSIAEITYVTIIQISKFGTICFFILAGFLIGDKFTDYTPLQYLKRRFNNTIWPWLFWSLLFIFIPNFDYITDKVRFKPDHPHDDGLQILEAWIRNTYLYTIYWFIPNFLFCITLLLVFKKHLYSYILGSILLLFVLFYTVNIYFEWISPGHTTAILGFVFFLWLGVQLNKNWQVVDAWITRSPLWLWWVLSFITLCLGLAETQLLKNLNNGDPYNSLRITNILFSLACFFLLLKIRDFDWIAFLKPRETTFGIYLIHYILVVHLLDIIFDPFNIQVNRLPLAGVFAYQILRFAITYSLTVISVILINKTKFKWLIGR